MKKYTLIFCTSLISFIASAMDENMHTITVYNNLHHSSVTISSPHHYSVNNQESQHYHDMELKSCAQKTLYIKPRNNQSHIQIILPPLYKQQSCDINCNGNSVVVIDADRNDQEETVSIRKDLEYLLETETIKDPISLTHLTPTHYYLAQRIVLAELNNKEYNHHHVTIANNSDEEGEIFYETGGTNTFKHDHPILAYTTQTISVWPDKQDLIYLVAFWHNKKCSKISLNRNQSFLVIEKDADNNMVFSIIT